MSKNVVVLRAISSKNFHPQFEKKRNVNNLKLQLIHALARLVAVSILVPIRHFFIEFTILRCHILQTFNLNALMHISELTINIHNQRYCTTFSANGF